MDPEKPSLESVATEIQLLIVRHLLFDEDTVEFGPLQMHQSGLLRRSLSIVRVSKHFCVLASSVLYGENSFMMLDSSILYHRHTSGPNDGPKDIRTVLSNRITGGAGPTMIYPTESVNRLDMLSIPTPAQNMLTRLSIATSRNIMQHFYDYSLLVILSRMRGLQLLRFIFKEKEPGNGLRYFDNEGEGPESNGCRFLFLVDCELAHVKEVAVKEDEEEEEEEEEEEDSIMVAKAMDYGLALRRVSAALEDRNRAWESPERVLRTFWGRFVGGDGWV